MALVFAKYDKLQQTQTKNFCNKISTKTLPLANINSQRFE